MNLELIFEHPKHRSMSIYRVMLDSTAQLTDLKKDLERKVSFHHQWQRLHHRNHRFVVFLLAMVGTSSENIRDIGLYYFDLFRFYFYIPYF